MAGIVSILQYSEIPKVLNSSDKLFKKMNKEKKDYFAIRWKIILSTKIRKKQYPG